ncbi:CAAD domain-containing protein [Anabaena azotica]|uniref:CAAD domain-containing protein n=1 Tax=Anabaena azotica FACHB-119 TaxID=947527 RepID=A0ABR8D819_9NOST|nr:CAAD domain-containing protein [Anabaena azotica]MBD2502415.1 CAAD domain-containing protein [Anabaena azotica FACHB-119]
METEQKPVESLNTDVSQGAIALPSAANNNLPKLPPATTNNTQWQQVSQQVTNFLAELPGYIGSFYQQYSQPILTVLIILSAIVTLKVVLALVGAINDIPLLAPLFELIGISYSGWFTFRYLLKASTRQELSAEINTLKNQVFGK